MKQMLYSAQKMKQIGWPKNVIYAAYTYGRNFKIIEGIPYEEFKYPKDFDEAITYITENVIELSEKESEVLKYSFQAGMSDVDVSEKIGVSKSRVGQYRKRILDKLMNQSGAIMHFSDYRKEHGIKNTFPMDTISPSELSTRVYNVLAFNHITSKSQLLSMSTEQIRSIYGIGNAGFRALIDYCGRLSSEDRGYPKNVMFEIQLYRNDYVNEDAVEYTAPENMDKSIELALRKSDLKDRYIKAFYSYFKDGVSQSVIAQNFNVTGAFVYSMIRRVIRELATNKFTLIMEGKEFIEDPDDVTTWNINARTKTCLFRNGIKGKNDFQSYTKSDILRFRNVGVTTFEDIMNVCKRMNIEIEE